MGAFKVYIYSFHSLDENNFLILNEIVIALLFYIFPLIRGNSHGLARKC